MTLTTLNKRFLAVLLLLFAYGSLGIFAQSDHSLSIQQYQGWIPTGYQHGIETSQGPANKLTWTVTDETVSRQHTPYYRGFAFKRFGTINTVEFTYEISGTPNGSVRLELWGGLGRNRIWNHRIKKNGTHQVSLSDLTIQNGLEFRLVPNARKLEPDVQVHVKNISFQENNLPQTSTHEFSGNQFSNWKETNMRDSVVGSSDDGLYFKTTRRIANDSNGWSRGFKRSFDQPVSKISFDYSSSANNDRRLILELLDGTGTVFWSKQLKKGDTDNQHVELTPGIYLRKGVEFRLRKNDYIIYGGTTARVDNVKVTTVKRKQDVAEKVSELKNQRGKRFVNRFVVRTASQPLPHHALPQGNIEVADSRGVEAGQKGYVAGRYCLFHNKDWIRLKGSGYFRIRWEVEHWVNAGRMILPTMKGDIVPLGERDGYNTGGGKSYPIVGPINKYYYLNGTCYIQVHEGAAYNLTVTRISYRNVIGSLERVF